MCWWNEWWQQDNFKWQSLRSQKSTRPFSPSSEKARTEWTRGVNQPHSHRGISRSVPQQSSRKQTYSAAASMRYPLSQYDYIGFHSQQLSIQHFSRDKFIKIRQLWLRFSKLTRTFSYTTPIQINEVMWLNPLIGLENLSLHIFIYILHGLHVIQSNYWFTF